MVLQTVCTLLCLFFNVFLQKCQCTEQESCCQSYKTSKRMLKISPCFKNLTLEDAEILLQEVVTIIDETDELDYWCAGLPDFTVQPPGEVNISVSQTLKLVTTVESELPVWYHWKRNGILLSGHHSSTLTLPNVQMVSLSYDSRCYCHVEDWSIPWQMIESVDSNVLPLLSPRLDIDYRVQ